MKERKLNPKEIEKALNECRGCKKYARTCWPEKNVAYWSTKTTNECFKSKRGGVL